MAAPWHNHVRWNDFGTVPESREDRKLIEEPVAHIIKWTLQKCRVSVNQWVYTGTYLRPDLLVVDWGARGPVEELQQLRAASHKEHQLLEEKEKHEIDSPAWIQVTNLTKCKINWWI